MSLRDQALHMHQEKQGKLEVKSKVEVQNAQDLSLAYSPGVAEPCKEIHEHPETVYDYTMKGNMVGVVTNGTLFLVLETSDLRLHFPLWKEKQFYLKALQA